MVCFWLTRAPKVHIHKNIIYFDVQKPTCIIFHTIIKHPYACAHMHQCVCTSMCTHVHTSMCAHVLVAFKSTMTNHTSGTLKRGENLFSIWANTISIHFNMTPISQHEQSSDIVNEKLIYALRLRIFPQFDLKNFKTQLPTHC
jgi:hypothetical protein